jgi:hypothetical protein
MRHFLINPTWRCMAACTYCWMHATIRPRPAMFSVRERPAQEWIDAINRDGIEVVDIAGGEPLLLDWMPDLFAACPRTTFGLTTNTLNRREVDRIAQAKPRNLVSINASFHADTYRWNPSYFSEYVDAVMALHSARLPVFTSVVDAPGEMVSADAHLGPLRDAGVRIIVAQYEHPDVVKVMRNTPLVCEGGVNHLTVAPDGSAWPCLTAMRIPEYADVCLGNWLDAGIDVARKPVPCYMNCADYYLIEPGSECENMWGLNVRAAEGAL